jgi:hypothetical protein
MLENGTLVDVCAELIVVIALIAARFLRENSR